MTQEKRYSIKLSGLEISVWKGDLTTHQVDAVVNAANNDLHHGAGLAGALVRVGGKSIQRWSDDIITNNGKVSTGEAVLTPAGRLPCKYIIHAVGPDLSYNPKEQDVQTATPLLRNAVCNIIKLAEQNNLQTVAIPALSSGLFNFPLERCADVIVKTVKDCALNKYQSSQLSEIRLVNNDEPTVSAMERACRNILGQKGSYSGAVLGTRTSSAASSLQMGDVIVHIKRGNIELEKVNVIVNTISPALCLSEGAISKAILKKAGDKIQNEIKLHHCKGFGDVIETNGYDLNCSCVYHTVCARRTVMDSAKILHSVVLKCLDKATWSKHTSISFPAIGTGNLDFSKQEVAQVMMRAVSDFAQKYQGKKMDVSFVLYPSEADTYKAFEKEMHSLKDATKRPSASSSPNKGSYSEHVSSYESSGAMNEAQAYIELHCNSTENRREATRWIHDRLLLMRKSCTIITNNHIQHFGLREHEELVSLQAIWKVSIGEFLRDGSAGVIIKGPWEGVKGAALAVEALCCQAQEEFARAEENAMLHTLVRWRCADIPELEEPENSGTLERAYLTGGTIETLVLNGSEIEVHLKKLEAENLSGKSCRIERSVLKDYDLKFPNKSFYQRMTINAKSTDQKGTLNQFNGLNIIKIEKVQNPLLEYHFKLKQKQVAGSPQRLYQQVPAQFCDLVCRVGFQRPYSLPKEQKYGAGIYFGHSVDTARKQAEHLCQEEEYIYIFEAQVLMGKVTAGSPHLIVPPALGVDPLSLYDSMMGGKDTCVIFNSHQALPVYLFTCSKPSMKTNL
ncbi:protein mono-ADP-ribosyltransferase PARP9 [Megalops cyprinoides]|uniref:protein mono-ADP-ribosyltransferase PARP9 n=1 Tax=Megalops cyprinoides TaxID=118141 RepID=UPI001864F782|nr:protein mono-ADP-ribosyltransferase PARP9 [Megalops cyprinoides]